MASFDQYGEWSSAGQGAASGAAAGSVFGPWGALIGGVAGAGYGYYKGRSQKRRMKKAEKLEKRRAAELRRRLLEDQRTEQQSVAEQLSDMGRQVGVAEGGGAGGVVAAGARGTGSGGGGGRLLGRVGEATSGADKYVLALANRPFERGLWDLNWSERMRKTGIPSRGERRADAIGNAMMAGSGVASAFGGTSTQPKKKKAQGVQVS